MTHGNSTNNSHMREFSMFFQAILSIFSAIALVMMNMIIDKMDDYTLEQQKLSLTLNRYMVSTDKDIESLQKKVMKMDIIQNAHHPTIDRAKRYFEIKDRIKNHDSK